ncbi:histone-lysine N-methyltransferase SETMAR [Trichonephila clavipes]|nr:histone-lysine N-methyltransferase SETMAR [Trichonephila clavipes]
MRGLLALDFVILNFVQVTGTTPELTPHLGNPTPRQLVSYRVLKVEINKEKIRYILQFFFDKGENVSQAAEIVNGVYGANTVTVNYVQFWFHRFRSVIFDVKDVPRTGRPVVENVDKIAEIIRIDQHVSSLSIAQELKIDNKTVLNHLRKLVIDQKRPELANRRGVIFHQDNARPHTSVVTRQKLWELGWEVLMHPPYSPDLAPSDYSLFIALQNFQGDKKSGSIEDCGNRLLEFFANKDQDFFERDIMKLLLKWQQILKQSSACLTQVSQFQTC